MIRVRTVRIVTIGACLAATLAGPAVGQTPGETGGGTMLRWDVAPAPPPSALEQGGVRLLYTSRRVAADFTFSPGEGALRAQALRTEPRNPVDDRRRSAKVSYALSDGVELFVDMQNRRKTGGDTPGRRDGFSEQAPKRRTVSIGVSARW